MCLGIRGDRGWIGCGSVVVYEKELEKGSGEANRTRRVLYIIYLIILYYVLSLYPVVVHVSTLGIGV